MAITFQSPTVETHHADGAIAANRSVRRQLVLYFSD
jgi:hypothetical protein